MRLAISLLMALVLMVALAAPALARKVPYGPCLSSDPMYCQFDGSVPPPIR